MRHPIVLYVAPQFRLEDLPYFLHWSLILYLLSPFIYSFEFCFHGFRGSITRFRLRPTTFLSTLNPARYLPVSKLSAGWMGYPFPDRHFRRPVNKAPRGAPKIGAHILLCSLSNEIFQMNLLTMMSKQAF